MQEQKETVFAAATSIFAKYIGDRRKPKLASSSKVPAKDKTAAAAGGTLKTPPLSQIQLVLREMLQIRGFSNFTEFQFKSAEYCIRCQRDRKEDKAEKQVLLAYICGEKIGKEVATKMVESWGSEPPTQLIVVGVLTSAAAATFRGATVISVFQRKELARNYTTHRLVPKHFKLSPEEATELIAKYRLQKTELPKVLSSDPIVRFFGWEVGDILRIQRSVGGIVHPIVYYRTVIAPKDELVANASVGDLL